MCVRPRLVLLALVALLLGSELALAGSKVRGAQPLKLGVVSFYNPRIMYLKYQPLVDYLALHTGTPWELVISPSYEQTVQDLCSGRLSLAYLGPLTYVRARAECGALPIVRLNTGESASYRALVMVKRDSPIQQINDLAGKVVGFGAPLSTSSHLVPREMLLDAGLVPGRDVRCEYFWHHDRAARAVLLGEVDACGIRDTVGRRFEQRGLRIIAESAPIPNFPLVAGPSTSSHLREQLVRALVTLPRADQAVELEMRGWDEELASGFAPGDDHAFDGIRAAGEKVFGRGYLSLAEPGLTCPTWGR
jgi:phosphonate transport system substrate-binding protein